MNIHVIVNDPLPAGYRVEVSDEGSPMKSATSTAGASLSQLNSPTLSPREVTGWGRGGTDVASPDHWEDYGGSLSFQSHLPLPPHPSPFPPIQPPLDVIRRNQLYFEDKEIYWRNFKK